jgi:hypothetical protein
MHRSEPAGEIKYKAVTAIPYVPISEVTTDSVGKSAAGKLAVGPNGNQ